MLIHIKKNVLRILCIVGRKNKLGILDMSMDGPYVKYIGRKNELTESDLEYESIVEDM